MHTYEHLYYVCTDMGGMVAVKGMATAISSAPISVTAAILLFLN